MHILKLCLAILLAVSSHTALANSADTDRCLGNEFSATPEQRLAACERVISKKPDDMQARKSKVTNLKKLRRYNDAIAEQKLIIGRRNVSLADMDTMAELLFHAKRWNELLSLADDTLQLFKNSSSARDILQFRGIALFHLERDQEALADLQAWTKENTPQTSYENTAVNLLKTLEQKLGLPPSDPKQAAAVCKNSQASIDSRKQACNIALTHAKTAEDKVRVIEYWAQANARAGDHQAVVTDWQEIDQLLPNNPHVQAALAEALVNVGKLKQALSYAETALSQTPQDPQRWYLRGAIHYESGNFQEAEADMLKVLELAPGNPQAENALQYIRNRISEN